MKKHEVDPDKTRFDQYGWPVAVCEVCRAEIQLHNKELTLEQATEAVAKMDCPGMFEAEPDPAKEKRVDGGEDVDLVPDP